MDSYRTRSRTLNDFDVQEINPFSHQTSQTTSSDTDESIFQVISGNKYNSIVHNTDSSNDDHENEICEEKRNEINLSMLDSRLNKSDTSETTKSEISEAYSLNNRNTNIISGSMALHLNKPIDNDCLYTTTLFPISETAEIVQEQRNEINSYPNDSMQSSYIKSHPYVSVTDVWSDSDDLDDNKQSLMDYFMY